MTSIHPKNQTRFVRNLFGNQLIEYKKTLLLTKEQHEIIIGTMLGDATMGYHKGQPYYCLKFEQGSAHADYIRHLYTVFEPYTSGEPYWRWIDSKTKTRESYWFRTYRHTDFQPYWHLFHCTIQRKKRVPPNIKELLTPRSVAYWFMDDGHQVNNAYFLNTQGFTKTESELLCTCLKDNFNISAKLSVDKTYWRIRIPVDSVSTFTELVKPYILDCFYYKLIF